ncbi:YlbF family regulator [Clostridia bacterium OttesenSCG-928-O13]|nr:YlbF family regulator [Clostridia bacterium OttesenSCG-928-O13]
MDAVQMFKEAAKALQEDPRYLELAKARKLNDEDTELQNKIGEFNRVRAELNTEIEKSERDDERVTELNVRINELYNGIMTSESMLAYNDAKQNIKGLISHINAIITAAVDGDDPMTVTEPVEGCGPDGCSSCSGCG